MSASSVSGSRRRAVSPLACSSRRARSAQGAAPSASNVAMAARSGSRARARWRARRSASPWASRVRAVSKRSGVRACRSSGALEVALRAGEARQRPRLALGDGGVLRRPRAACPGRSTSEIGHGGDVGVRDAALGEELLLRAQVLDRGVQVPAAQLQLGQRVERPQLEEGEPELLRELRAPRPRAAGLAALTGFHAREARQSGAQARGLPGLPREPDRLLVERDRHVRPVGRGRVAPGEPERERQRADGALLAGGVDRALDQHAAALVPL